MIKQNLITGITNAILSIFPSCQTIVLWGSAVTKDFNSETSDVDLVIFLPGKIHDFPLVQVLLHRLNNKFKKKIRLDPSVAFSKTASEFERSKK